MKKFQPKPGGSGEEGWLISHGMTQKVNGLFFARRIYLQANINVSSFISLYLLAEVNLEVVL